MSVGDVPRFMLCIAVLARAGKRLFPNKGLPILLQALNCLTPGPGQCLDLAKYTFDSISLYLDLELILAASTNL